MASECIGETMMIPFNFANKKVIVAGGGGHIGQAITKQLTDGGAWVAILDRQFPWSSLPYHVIPIECDLTDEAQTRRRTQQAIEELEGLDVLIHCAALTGDAGIPGYNTDFMQQTVAAWDVAIRVNLTSAFVLAQECWPALIAGEGNIVFVSSIYGVVAPDKSLYEGTNMAGVPVAYAVSKAGLLGLTRYLAAEFAPVRVNCVSPGGIVRKQPSAFVGRYTAKTPMGRMLTEQDVSDAVCWLASDASGMVTGHNLIVDGGYSLT